jgi:hypothetical protein
MAEDRNRSPADLAAPAGHNGGPPLDQEHTPEWGNDGIGNYFYWKAAHRKAWKNPSPGVVAFRIRKAERLGLTYEEYTLEFLNEAVTCRSRTSRGSKRSSGGAQQNTEAEVSGMACLCRTLKSKP